MKFLYVLNTFNLPNQPGSGRFYQFSKWLVDQGHEVYIFCNARHNWTDKIIFDGTVENPNIVDGIKIVGLKTPAGRRKSKILRVFNYLVLTVQVYIQGRRLKGLDSVIAGSPPLFVPIAALATARYHKVKSILEVRDLYPHTAIALGVVKNKLIIKLWEKFEKYLRDNFDKIVVSLPRLLPMLEEVGVPESKITIVTNGYDPENDEKVKLSQDLSQFFSDNKKRFIVGYTGNMGLAWNIPCMVEAAEILKDRDDISFFFLGKGEYFEPCSINAKQKGLDRVSFFAPVGRQEALEATRNCDALMFMYFDDDFFDYALPNKFFDYMGAGKPLIYGGAGSVEDILNESEGGIVIPANDAESLSIAITKLADDRKKTTTMGRNNREYTEKELFRDKQLHNWAKVLFKNNSNN